MRLIAATKKAGLAYPEEIHCAYARDKEEELYFSRKEKVIRTHPRLLE
jgi:hypothetical protein